MLDPQTRQQLQTKFQQVKPQLKQRFSGVTDQDLDSWQNDPEKLITTIHNFGLLLFFQFPFYPFRHISSTFTNSLTNWC